MVNLVATTYNVLLLPVIDRLDILTVVLQGTCIVVRRMQTNADWEITNSLAAIRNRVAIKVLSWPCRNPFKGHVCTEEPQTSQLNVCDRYCAHPKTTTMTNPADTSSH